MDEIAVFRIFGRDGEPDVRIDLTPQVRQVARQEVASLCGLVLSRLNADPREPLAQKLASAFGEALRDFGATDEQPGA